MNSNSYVVPSEESAGISISSPAAPSTPVTVGSPTLPAQSNHASIGGRTISILPDTTYVRNAQLSSTLLTFQQLDAGAPNDYVLPVKMHAGTHLVDGANGSVKAVNNTGTVLATFAVPHVVSPTGSVIGATLAAVGSDIDVRVEPARGGLNLYPREISTDVTYPESQRNAARPNALPVGNGGNVYPPCHGKLLDDYPGEYPYLDTLAVLAQSGKPIQWGIQFETPYLGFITEPVAMGAGTNRIGNRRLVTYYYDFDKSPYYLWHQGFENFTRAGSNKPQTLKSGQVYSISLDVDGSGTLDDGQNFGYHGEASTACLVM